MRFKVHCLIFLFIKYPPKILERYLAFSADTLPCNIMGMKSVLRVNIRLWCG